MYTEIRPKHNVRGSFAVNDKTRQTSLFVSAELYFCWHDSWFVQHQSPSKPFLATALRCWIFAFSFFLLKYYWYKIFKFLNNLSFISLFQFRLRCHNENKSCHQKNFALRASDVLPANIERNQNFDTIQAWKCKFI